MAESKSPRPENGLLTTRQPEPIAIIGMGIHIPHESVQEYALTAL